MILSGSGYVESLTAGKNIVYNITAAKAIDDAEIAVHYGMWNTTTQVRGVLVKVNGNCINDGAAIKTTYTNKGTKGQVVEGRWIDSGFVSNVSLVAGANEIVIEGASSSQTYNSETYTPTDDGCLPNIDYLIVKGVGISAGAQIVDSTYYTLSYASENETAGTVSSSVSKGSVKENTSVTLTAQAKTGWQFEC